MFYLLTYLLTYGVSVDRRYVKGLEIYILKLNLYINFTCFLVPRAFAYTHDSSSVICFSFERSCDVVIALANVRLNLCCRCSHSVPKSRWNVKL